MAAAALTPAELSTLQAAFSGYALRFQQQLSSLDSSKSAFSLASPMEVDATKAVANQEFSSLLTALRAGAINGLRITNESFKALVVRLATSLKNYAKALEAWNARSPTAVLGDLAKSAFALSVEVLKRVSDIAMLPGRIIMWGAIGVAAIFLLPPLLRTFSAYKRGGARAAADEAAASLERGQAAIKTAAKKTAELTARAGAAYASGGASERVLALKNAAVSGMRRKSRRRSRR